MRFCYARTEDREPLVNVVKNILELIFINAVSDHDKNQDPRESHKTMRLFGSRLISFPRNMFGVFRATSSLSEMLPLTEVLYLSCHVRYW